MIDKNEEVKRSVRKAYSKVVSHRIHAVLPADAESSRLKRLSRNLPIFLFHFWK